MMDILQGLFHNAMLWNALLAWVLAQLLKTLYTKIKTGKFRPDRLIGPGGMPSSHSALMCALTVTIGRVDGVTSPAFAVAFVFTCVVMYDAMGVRWHAGQHAKIINKLVEIIDADEHDADQHNKLKEVLGHKPVEVFVGAVLGLLLGLFMPIR